MHKHIFGHHLWAAAVIAVVAILLVVFVLPILGPAVVHFGKGDQSHPPPLQTQAPVESQLEQFKGEYGPWMTAEQARILPKVAGVRNLALISSNGNVAYSAKSAAFDGKEPWRTDRPPEVTGVSVSETSVSFSDLKGNVFTLNTSQPFVFAGHLTRVYLIDGSRQVWSAPIQDLAFKDTVGLADPAILPNPNLSPSFGN